MRAFFDATNVMGWAPGGKLLLAPVATASIPWAIGGNDAILAFGGLALCSSCMYDRVHENVSGLLQSGPCRMCCILVKSVAIAVLVAFSAIAIVSLTLRLIDDLHGPLSLSKRFVKSTLRAPRISIR